MWISRTAGLNAVALAACFAGELPKFVDATRAAGLAGFINKQGTARKDYIVESIGGGAAWFDYDGDSRLDALLVRGTDLTAYAKGGEPVCALFRNNGDGSFSDVTAKAGLGSARGWGMGVTAADYNGDGRTDLFVTGYGRNFLFRNRGDGAFEEVAAKAGVVSSGLWSAGGVFFDYDRDGHLDLYVSRYVRFDAAKPISRSPECQYQGVGVFCGPQGLVSEPHSLYRNLGDGTFRDVSEQAGIRPIRGAAHGMGVIALDYDNDGWQDLYVANDSSSNLLWRNDGKGRFRNMAIESGVAFSSDGMEQASMGVDAGDLFRRGALDLHVTNFSNEPNELYRSGKDFVFEDVTWESGIGKPTLPYLGWSTHFLDLDADGWLDIVTVNGHVYPEVDSKPMGTSYRQRLLAFRHRGDGKFEDVSAKLGPAFEALYAGRGAAVGDYDNDGDLDLLINNIDGPPALLRNDSAKANWIGVRVEGQAVGARVHVRAGGAAQMTELRTQSGYFSTSDPRAWFGLGASTEAEEIRVTWPDGRVRTVGPVEAGQYVTVR